MTGRGSGYHCGALFSFLSAHRHAVVHPVCTFSDTGPKTEAEKSEAQQSSEKLLGLWRLINLSLIQRMTRFYENLGRVRYPVHD